MSNFVPPFPPRLAKAPSTFKRLALARRNFLSIWEEAAFEFDYSFSQLITRKVFLCNSPEAVQFAFSLKHASFERKAPQMRYALQPLIGDGHFISDGEIWRQRRRMVAPIIHISQMSRFAPIMVEAAIEVRDRWSKRDGEMIDVLNESAMLTAEVICRTVFGRKLGQDYARDIVEGFSEYQQVVNRMDLISLIGLPDWFPRWNRPAMRRAVNRIHRVLDNVIAAYRAKKGNDTSMIGRLLEARDEQTGEMLSDEALRNEIAVLFLAGQETSANSLAWTWYLLSQAPEVETRLQKELSDVLGGRPPTFADVPNLVYTRAVLEEALRLYPPIPILPREAVQEEHFKGEHIPKGSLVLVVPWLLHRHKKLWDKPDHFIPERFLPENAKSISKFGYIPFSIGPRICSGFSFGLTESVLFLATLAQHFRLRMRPGDTVLPTCKLTLRPEGGIPMRVERLAS
ncbi:MAG TPA: cytochrome P450 [Xanthobacteraceae bacterium]|nr:cytochrome P450 [Xanthobacteraceae bacterium]